MRDENTAPAAKAAAAKELLDRGYGKSATLNYNVNTDTTVKPAELTENELRKRVGEAIARLEGPKGTSGEDESAGQPIDIRKYN